MKKKSALAAILSLCLAVAVVVPCMATALARSAPNQDPTEYLEQTMISMGYTPEGNYQIDEIYSENLTPNGYEYSFTLGDSPCYALMIREVEGENTYYDIMEIFFDTPSPFAQATGKKVYVDMFTYIDAAEQGFFDLSSGAELTQEQVREIAEQGNFVYEHTGRASGDYEVISYARKTVNEFEFEYGLPENCYSEQPNSCGNVAGANILQYYDIKYPNLIPNFEPLITTVYETRYRRHTDGDDATDALFGVTGQLYYDMKTDKNNGTTYTDFKTGLTAYIERQGYNRVYTSVIASTGFNYTYYKMQVRSGYPVALFMETYNLSQGPLKDRDENMDHVSVNYYTVPHVMVGSGFLDIDYYNKNGTIFRIENWLKVSSGNFIFGNGYMRMYDNEQFNGAIGVKIY